jgi:AcrR family transcriptional regulator
MSTATKLSGQERRAAIVESAIKLFSEKGFRGTTTRELASAVGVSEPVLYQHFSTKRELYAAIIDTKCRDAERVIGHLESLSDKNDDHGFFSHVARLIIEFHDSNPSYLRLLLFSALEGHELSDLMREKQANAFENVVVGYIERRIRDGAFRSLDPSFVARTFTGMVAYHCQARILYKCHCSPLSRENLIQEMVGIFLKGIENEKP